ncbi:unnamed protein product [Phyllotreta striolata]|uniref:Uncharacterized protein n=1 Tax=Phyllotreta striolata TaxID=444603 RepID=A0A9N9TF73_PHYSR|nr:unnamed protein product [Phyllotreta striolata]
MVKLLVAFLFAVLIISPIMGLPTPDLDTRNAVEDKTRGKHHSQGYGIYDYGHGGYGHRGYGYQGYGNGYGYQNYYGYNPYNSYYNNYEYGPYGYW